MGKTKRTTVEAVPATRITAAPNDDALLALLDAGLVAMLGATRLGADVPVLPGMPTSA